MNTASRSWYRSSLTLIAASLLFPPAGLVVLWSRAQTGILKRILVSVPIAALGLAHLFLFYGLRMEVDGSGITPIFSFHNPDSHYRQLERSRAEQPKSSAASFTVAVPVSAEPAAKAPSLPVSAGSEPPASRVPATGNGLSTYWTNFRGPQRNGIYEEMDILTDWPGDGLRELWRQKVGGGYASFVIAKGKIFTIEQRRERETVAAYDLKTGNELWTHSWPAEFREPMGGDGPRATPTWDEGRVYALGATGEFWCLAADTGEVLWGKNILTDNGADNLHWGMAASPLIVEEKVIVLPGGRSGKSVVAYDKITGNPIWKALDDKQAYTSPMLVTLAGKRQLLVVSARRAMGITVEDGTLLWDYRWRTDHDINASQPILLGENRFFISAGYGHGAALVEVTSNGDGFSTREVWGNIQMKNKFTSSVLHEGHIYGLDESILACIDAETGQRKWKGGRYGYGQVMLASGHLIVLTEAGDLVLVPATPDGHKELARFSALEGKTWNHPAISDGILLVRNTTEMAGYRIGAP